MTRFLKHIFSNPIPIYPLVTFRIIFGLLMFVSTVRFWANGWIEEQYIMPEFFFSYYGFEWVKPLSEPFMYITFSLIALSALAVAAGLFYRVAAVIFFVCFTYVELIDVTNYLNHYYFVSLVAFLMIWLPANRFFSLDALFRGKEFKRLTVPAWTINIIKLQLGIVYFYAGLAKLNSDWLFHALPLKIWLPAKTNAPLIGSLLDYEWVAYAFSWGGAAFDLSIFFLLILGSTRMFGYILVIVFHLTTWALFPIGMFPFIMIGSTLIFFSSKFHQRLLNALSLNQISFINENRFLATARNDNTSMRRLTGKLAQTAIALYIIFQLCFPFRHLLYNDDNLFWTEQGYRFSWRVMLMEKAGYATFYVTDPETGNTAAIDNSKYLTPNQEKMMATQPDMILQFAHYLKEEYEKQGFSHLEVTVEAYVTLNGEGSKLFIDPNVNLAAQQESFKPKNWVLPAS